MKSRKKMLDEHERTLMARGDKLAAIKAVRQRLRLSLIECVQLVNAYQKTVKQ